MGLRSANFTVNIEGDNVIFEVIGYGHGVGMSQTGADSMAKLGNDYETIIKHYYTGVEIENVSWFWNKLIKNGNNFTKDKIRRHDKFEKKRKKNKK